VSLILEAFTPDTKIIGTGAAIAVVIALILRFFPKVRHVLKPHKGYAFWTALPWFLTAALAVVLIFVVLPDRAVKQSSLLANKWLKWQKDLEGAAGQCTKAKDRDKCLAEQLSPVIDNRPRPERQSDATGLASDLMAGQLMLANENARSALNDRLGIREKFLGSGRSEPVGQTNYTAASVPEYLVPNLSDKSPNVWVWEPEQVQDQKPIMEQNLLEVLHTFPPANTAVNHQDFEHNWSWLKDHLQPNDPRPILVRFALIPQTIPYSGCLGRPEATRVFMSNLGELAPKTVHDAAQSTGYVVPEKSDDPGLRLFIWVYAPTEEDQAVSATWGNVLANFGKWITAEPCKNAN
jgi:hypothetical protein